MSTAAPAAGSADLRTRNAVGISFAVNGVLFASLAARLPDIRSSLELSNSALGTLLFAVALGSVVALPTAGRLVERWSATVVVRIGAICAFLGLVGAGASASAGSVVATGVGWALYGIGIAIWDVAMNVEAAEVERRLRRTIMPRFHAGWSFGSITGAAIGIPMAALHVPLVVHLGVTCSVVLVLAWVSAGRFWPVETAEEGDTARGPSAWREPRVLAIGVMVFCFALVEGTANDWLSLAIIDGYRTPHWVGVAAFTAYVCAMTSGRLLGPVLPDRHGRVPVLLACALCAMLGTLLVVYGQIAPVVGAGILLWGLGASLGFPVGISAAADEPARAAVRVGVVSTIAYGAFLAGPPVFGHLGQAVGTLPAMLGLAALMVPAAISVRAARPAVPARDLS